MPCCLSDVLHYVACPVCHRLSFVSDVLHAMLCVRCVTQCCVSDVSHAELFVRYGLCAVLGIVYNM